MIHIIRSKRVEKLWNNIEKQIGNCLPKCILFSSPAGGCWVVRACSLEDEEKQLFTVQGPGRRREHLGWDWQYRGVLVPAVLLSVARGWFSTTWAGFLEDLLRSCLIALSHRVNVWRPDASCALLCPCGHVGGRKPQCWPTHRLAEICWISSGVCCSDG